jgi:hypothetical protein
MDYAKETRRVSEQVELLAASNSSTAGHLSEQIAHKLGTNRRSEILAKIGNTGQVYQKIFNDYLDTL